MFLNSEVKMRTQRVQLGWVWINKYTRMQGGVQVCLPGLRVLLVHPLLGLLEQAHGLLGLVAQVLHEDAEVLVLPQDLHLAFVAGQEGAKVLVGVGQQVQDVWGAVLQRHLGILTQTHHLEAHKDSFKPGGGRAKRPSLCPSLMTLNGP